MEQQTNSSQSTHYAKERILAVLNGGKVEELAFQKQFEEEMKATREAVLTLYPKYKDFKAGTANTPLSLMLQDIENWIMRIVREELVDSGCSVASHDGVMTMKRVSPERLQQLTAVVAEKTVVFKNIKFAGKPIPPHSWDLDRCEKSARDAQKRAFSSYD